MFINTPEVIVVGTVAAVALAGVIYKKQQPPSHDEIQGHIDNAADFYAKHEESLDNAKLAAVQHVASQNAKIDALSSGIVSAQESINTANKLVAGL